MDVSERARVPSTVATPNQRCCQLSEDQLSQWNNSRPRRGIPLYFAVADAQYKPQSSLPF